MCDGAKNFGLGLEVDACRALLLKNVDCEILSDWPHSISSDGDELAAAKSRTLLRERDDDLKNSKELIRALFTTGFGPKKTKCHCDKARVCV